MLHKPRLSELRTVARNKVEKPKNCLKKQDWQFQELLYKTRQKKLRTFEINKAAKIQKL